MSAVTGPSDFEIFEITSNDGNKTVSIANGVMDFQYFEDLYSPTVTAIVEVANTGNTINGGGLYHGLPIRGGERVFFRIKTPLENALQSQAQLECVMYVDKVTDLVNDRQLEAFRLHLVSREAITNEQVRVTTKFTGKTIDKSLSEIIKLLEPLKLTKFEGCENTYDFMGNLRKPFTLAVMLAARAVPVGAKSKSAGFFFWQTRKGFHFKSIFKMTKDAVEKKKELKKYFYSQIMNSGVADPLINAYKILSFSSNKNTDLTDTINKGEYSSYRMFFNPLTFEFNQPDNAIYKGGSSVRLGHTEKPPKVADPENIPASMLAPRIILGVQDVGTFKPGVSTAINYDPANVTSQAVSQYSQFFTQDYNILIAANTEFVAGDPINVEFPKTTTDEPDIDTEQSGLYIIKEITHKFTRTKSFTSMRVVRDTFGVTGQK